MNKKLVVYFTAVVLALSFLLPGCGKKIDDETYEYTHINTLVNRICKYGMPIGDISSAVFDKPEDPNELFILYINPLATDPVIELYLDDIAQADTYLAGNSKYMKYIKKNSPYYISLDCRGENIGKVDLNGKFDREETHEIILAGIGAEKERALAELNEFEGGLQSIQGLNRDENGQYYFVVDSLHVSDSVDEIWSVMDEAEKINPFSEEDMNHWVDSNSMIENKVPSYQLYIDEYGSDGLFDAQGISFSFGARTAYNAIYRFFVPQGDVSLPDGQLKLLYYSLIQNDGGNWVYISYEDYGSVSTEDIKAELYDLYDRIVTAHEEHDIKPLGDIKLSGSCGINDEVGKAIVTDLWIPMDKRMTEGEFNGLFDEGSDIIDESELFKEAE